MNFPKFVSLYNRGPENLHHTFIFIRSMQTSDNQVISFKAKLSQRIGIDEVRQLVYLTQNNDSRKQELYELISDTDESTGYYAAWVFTHFSPEENKWLYNKQNELIDEVLSCRHGGKRRLILGLLYRQPLTVPPRVDFLDFCLERMVSLQELPGVRSLCMKLAYELCRSIPELLQEFNTMLEMMESESIPSIQTVRKNVLKAMQKRKSLQNYS